MVVDCGGHGTGLPFCIIHHPQRRNEVVCVDLGIDVSMDGGNHWKHVVTAVNTSPDFLQMAVTCGWRETGMSLGANGTLTAAHDFNHGDDWPNPEHLNALAKEVSRVSGLDVTCTRDCEVLGDELRAFDGRFAVSTSTLRRFLG